MAKQVPDSLFASGKHLDSRCVRQNVSDILTITDAYVGMIVYITSEDKYYKVDAVEFTMPTSYSEFKTSSSAYKPSGSKTVSQLTSSLLIETNLGNIYNITDSGSTNEYFVEGTGHPIAVGANVVIVDVGTSESPSYKFDLVGGFIDLSDCQQKITSSNKLSADLIENGATNKVVTQSEKDTWNSKQNALTFDNAPTAGSNNPVTSGGVKTAIANMATKPLNPSMGKFVNMDASGNLRNSGLDENDFAIAAQGTKADTAVQIIRVGGNPISKDADGRVDIPVMQGATPSADGMDGLVPQPSAGDEEKFLQGDGNWADPPQGEPGPAGADGHNPNLGTFDITNYSTDAPTQDIQDGDFIVVIDSGTKKIYLWNGSAWTDSGATFSDAIFATGEAVGSTSLLDYIEIANKNIARNDGVFRYIQDKNLDIVGILEKSAFSTSNLLPYYLVSNGNATYSTNRAKTAPIKVSQGDVFSYNLNEGATVYMIAALDSSMQLVTASSVAGTGAAVEGTYTVPSGVAYLSFCGLTANTNPKIVKKTSAAFLDNVPTKNSEKLVRSGGVWDKTRYCSDDFNCFRRYKNDGSDVGTYSNPSTIFANLYYTAVVSLVLKGFDKTKPHKMRMLTRNVSGNYRLVISAYDGESWADVFDKTLTNLETSQNNPGGICKFDATIDTKTVEAYIDYANLPTTNVVLEQVETTPHYIIKESCFAEEQQLPQNILTEDDLEIGVISNNIANPADIVTDKLINNNGLKVNGEGWAYIGIPVSGGEIITIGGFVLNRVSAAFYAFYYNDSKVGDVGSFYDSDLPLTINVPSGINVDTLFIDIKTAETGSNYDNLMANYGSTLKQRDVYTEGIKKIDNYPLAGANNDSDLTERVSALESDVEDLQDALTGGIESLVADLPTSVDGAGIEVGYAYINSSTGVVTVKMS